MGNKWTNTFGCKATSRLVLMGCGFVLDFLTQQLYCIGLVCLKLSSDEAPLFPLKREKKVVLVNNPPLSYSKSMGTEFAGFEGCVGMCQTISPLSCDTLLHTSPRLLGHLCLCSVARPPCSDISKLVRGCWAGSSTVFHQQITARALLALLHVWWVPAKVLILSSLWSSTVLLHSAALQMKKLLVTVFLDVRHFGGKLALSRAVVQLLLWPPDPQGPLQMALMSMR